MLQREIVKGRRKVVINRRQQRGYFFAYKKGLFKKEDLGAALRAHQAAVDATKSPQRDVAEEYYRDTIGERVSLFDILQQLRGGR